MKGFHYLLPVVVYTSACSTLASPDSSFQIPSPLEISFSPYSWELSPETMEEIRGISANMPQTATVSLEACIGNQGHGERFQKKRLEGIESFFFPERREVISSLTPCKEGESPERVTLSLDYSLN